MEKQNLPRLNSPVLLGSCDLFGNPVQAQQFWGRQVQGHGCQGCERHQRMSLSVSHMAQPETVAARCKFDEPNG